MNVTFSCKVLSRWAQLVSVFSRMFKFSRIVIYRAKSRRSDLEWGDLLILFNRNNCSLSVGVFSFSLIWESIAAQFLTFVPHGEQTLVEKDSPSSMKTKSSFFSRSANFGNVSPSGRRNKYIFRAYSSTHKITELCFEILQFFRSARLFRLTPPSRSRHRLCWRTATSTHFWSSTFSVNQSLSVSNSQRVVTRFLTARRHFWTPWSKRIHCMENGQSVFFLSPHTP